MAANGISSPLRFAPLEDEMEKQEKQENEIQLSKEAFGAMADYLMGVGEDESADYELLEERDALQGKLITADDLMNVMEFARTPEGDSRKKSEHDTSLFKIRYKYAGSPIPQREFCQRIMLVNKVYRYEDLKAAEKKVVNEGFGPGGTDRYDIFLYKGGVNCRHWWQRVIYLKKGNKRIGVNEARRMILALDPKDRADARWVSNDPRAAQIASPSNNHWKLN